MGWVVNATTRPFYPRERPGTHYLGGWVGPRVGLDGCGKSRPNGIRSQDRPARSERCTNWAIPAPVISIVVLKCEFIYSSSDSNTDNTDLCLYVFSELS